MGQDDYEVRMRVLLGVSARTRVGVKAMAMTRLRAMVGVKAMVRVGGEYESGKDEWES